MRASNHPRPLRSGARAPRLAPQGLTPLTTMTTTPHPQILARRDALQAGLTSQKRKAGGDDGDEAGGGGGGGGGRAAKRGMLDSVLGGLSEGDDSGSGSDAAEP